MLFSTWILWCVIVGEFVKTVARKKIQKMPLSSVSLMHHQNSECGPQWEMRFFQGTATPDQSGHQLT